MVILRCICVFLKKFDLWRSKKFFVCLLQIIFNFWLMVSISIFLSQQILRLRWRFSLRFLTHLFWHFISWILMIWVCRLLDVSCSFHISTFFFMIYFFVKARFSNLKNCFSNFTFTLTENIFGNKRPAIFGLVFE